jgi:hypothetical protein
MHRPSLGAFDGYTSTIFSYTEAALIASECYSTDRVDSRLEPAGIDANCTVLRNAIGVFTRRKDLPGHAVSVTVRSPKSNGRPSRLWAMPIDCTFEISSFVV